MRARHSAATKFARPAHVVAAGLLPMTASTRLDAIYYISRRVAFLAAVVVTLHSPFVNATRLRTKCCTTQLTVTYIIWICFTSQSRYYNRLGKFDCVERLSG